MVSLSCLGTIPPREAPHCPSVCVAVSWGRSHMLRPWSCSKTKTSSKIWGFPKAQLLPEQLSVSPGGTLWHGALGCTGDVHPGGQQ